MKISYRNVFDISPTSTFAYLDLSCIDACFSEVFDQPLRNQPQEYHIVCPMCKGLKEVAQMSLYPNAKWKSVKCTLCKKYKTSRQWLCSCSIPWHSCPLHAAQGHACGSAREEANTNVESMVVARKLHVHFSLSNGQPQPVNGRFRRGSGCNRGPGVRNQNRKRPATRQQAASKRARLTPVSGIPRSFLPVSLAARFQYAVKSEPATHSSASS